MRSYKVSRRSFLRGIGGSIGLYTLLRNIEAHAQEATSPARLMVIHHPVGTIPHAWVPQGSGRDYVASRLLAPFEAAGLREDMIPMYPFQFGLGGPGGGHEKGTVVMMTGTPTAMTRAGQPETDDPMANGPSIDQLLLAKSAALSAPPIKSLYALCDDRIDFQEISVRCLRYGTRRIAVGQYAVGSPDGAQEENEPLRPRLRPLDLYTDVFGTMMPGGTDREALTRALMAKKSVLDFSLRELARLRTLAPASSLDMIEIHETAIRDLEREIEGLIENGNDAESCGVLMPPPNVVGGEGSFNDYGSEEATTADNDLHEQIGKLHHSIIVAAMRCDLTRVGLFQWSPGTNHIAFEGLWPDNAASIYMHHPISHRVGDADIDGGSGHPTEMEFLIRVEEWYNEKTAELVAAMKNTTDIYGGNLLDNTVVPYVTEVGRATHRHHDIPVVLFGGKNLGVQGGQYIDMGGQGLHNDMWLTVAQALGVSMDDLRGERGVMYDAGSYNGVISGVLG